jgi:hypothetical protein
MLHRIGKLEHRQLALAAADDVDAGRSIMSGEYVG